MGLVVAKSIASATIVFLVLLAQRHSNDALAALAATLPVGTIIGVIAFASAEPSGAQTFTRSAVLALPVWGAFAVSTHLLTRVLDWRVAVAAGSWSGPAGRSSTCT
jgi:uncharacterized membrane protein (GlpM family)